MVYGIYNYINLYLGGLALHEIPWKKSSADHPIVPLVSPWTPRSLVISGRLRGLGGLRIRGLTFWPWIFVTCGMASDN